MSGALGAVTYSFSADGTKVAVEDNSGNGYQYMGSLIYAKSGSTLTLESARFAHGYIAPQDGQVYYHTTDHLGSVRAITNMQGSVVERNGYYPFGSETALGSSYPKLLDNRMKFNGKEEQTIGNLGLLDYGARMYDPAIGRWTAQDPLSEKYYSFSAYNYCVNNPVMFVDLDGRDWFYYKKDDNSNYEWHWHEGTTYNTGMKDDNGNDIILKGYSAVVIFNGSVNEKLGENNSLFGKGAVLADVTVYGPGGANDIEYYQGYTMTSDPTRWGVIADGEYIVNYDEIGKSGNLKSHWAINGRGKVPAKDGINPSPYRSYDNALVGTFIHSTKENGFMGNYWNSKRQDFGGISEGCLIIAPSVYNHDGKLLKKGWDQYNNQLKGVHKHLLKLVRH